MRFWKKNEVEKPRDQKVKMKKINTSLKLKQTIQQQKTAMTQEKEKKKKKKENHDE